MLKPTFHVVAAVVVLIVGSAETVRSQETLERTTNLSGGWIGQNGFLYANLPYRFRISDEGGRHVVGSPTFEFGLGLPWRMLGGVRFAHQSPTVPGEPEEWEIFARRQLLGDAPDAPLDLALGGGFNAAARSFDGEISLARWLGPLRFLAAARGMTDGFGAGDPRIALAAGGVFHPSPGGLPIALAADVGSLLDRQPDEHVAWSAAVQVGLPFTDHTLSLFSTNTATSTVQGRSRGYADTRYGFELTIPIPVGRFVGWFVPREQAMDAVVEVTEPPAGVYAAEATRYQFFPRRIEISAGTVVRWTNTDDVLHTVAAEDGSWDSGGIRPGESWSARFDRPGLYPFLCGPHPFMKGVVIVR